MAQLAPEWWLTTTGQVAQIPPDRRLCRTGISIYTIYEHVRGNCSENFKLTHLTYLNLGGVGFKDIRENGKDNRYKQILNVSNALNLPIVLVDTNEREWFGGIKHIRTHTLRTLSSVLALQKLFKAYYFSSSYPADAFNFNGDTAYFDLFTLPLLSTENVQFYSHSPSVSRMEKIRTISEFEITHNNLRVCIRDTSNCGVCEKCKRTMLELFSINKLSLYDRSFNVDKFERNIKYYVIEALLKKKDKKWYAEIVEEMNKNKQIKFLWKVEVALFKFVPEKLRDRYIWHYQKQ